MTVGFGPGASEEIKLGRFKVGAVMHNMEVNEYRVGEEVLYTEEKVELYIEGKKNRYSMGFKNGNFVPPYRVPVNDQNTRTYGGTQFLPPSYVGRLELTVDMNEIKKFNLP